MARMVTAVTKLGSSCDLYVPGMSLCSRTPWAHQNQVLHGIAWYCMVVHGITGCRTVQHMALQGIVRYPVVSHGIALCQCGLVLCMHWTVEMYTIHALVLQNHRPSSVTACRMPGSNAAPHVTARWLLLVIRFALGFCWLAETGCGWRL